MPCAAIELELYYQPRIDLASGQVMGVECLLRWFHPEHGLIPPDVFIPAAERSGLIVPIGYWVIEQACQRLQDAAAAGFPELVFAVNLSFRQFHDRKMTETIFRIIYNANIDTRLLELELTESAMMHDPDYAQRCLRELNQLGISFALDDFGTGFSSLSNLQHLPISLVKIDKSFVQRTGRDQRCGAHHAGDHQSVPQPGYERGGRGGGNRPAGRISCATAIATRCRVTTTPGPCPGPICSSSSAARPQESLGSPEPEPVSPLRPVQARVKRYNAPPLLP